MIKLKQPNKNYIPDLNADRSRFWRYYRQPDRKDVVIDDTHAMMSQKTFDKLENCKVDFHCYCDLGKMFKSNRYNNGNWTLIWFGLHPDPNRVSIEYRKIIIV